MTSSTSNKRIVIIAGPNGARIKGVSIGLFFAVDQKSKGAGVELS